MIRNKHMKKYRYLLAGLLAMSMSVRRTEYKLDF